MSWSSLKCCKGTAVTQTHRHMLLVQSLCSHTHPLFFLLASLPFLSLYSGNKITAFAKKFSYPVNHREAGTFQRLIHQEQFGNSTRKHYIKKLKGARADWGVPGYRRPQGRHTAIMCMNEKGLLVLILLFFLFCWLHQCRSLPGGASSFFPCYF